MTKQRDDSTSPLTPSPPHPITPSSPVPTLRWIGDVDGHLRLIDQTRLPVELVEIECHDVATLWEAIKSLRVRGAPAIGVAAAYGVCLGLQPVGQAGEPVGQASRLAESPGSVGWDNRSAVPPTEAGGRSNMVAGDPHIPPTTCHLPSTTSHLSSDDLFFARLDEIDRLSRLQPPDGRQSLLGPGADEAEGRQPPRRDAAG